MPTPFFHLSIARELMQRSDLSEAARTWLGNQHCAFLLGNTAPDVQMVSGQSRAATHFFDIPIQPGDAQPWERLLARHPVLAHPQNLDAAQAAFVVGYMCHLKADWDWVKEIFFPIFGPSCTWATFHQRLYYHNVLRAYMDQRLLPGLLDGMKICLGAVEPSGWLPFVADRHLKAWRDLLAPQFHPDAPAQTVEVFAARQGIPSEEYYALLRSEARMQTEIFSHLPYQKIETYRQRSIVTSAYLVERYLADVTGSARPAGPSRAVQPITSASRQKETHP